MHVTCVHRAFAIISTSSFFCKLQMVSSIYNSLFIFSHFPCVHWVSFNVPPLTVLHVLVYIPEHVPTHAYIHTVSSTQSYH